MTSLKQSRFVRSNALLCAAGVWLVAVVMCAGRVLPETHPSESEGSRAGQVHHGERGHEDNDHHGSSENCCEDIRAFPANEFQSFTVVTPAPAGVLDFLALGELSPWTVVQQSCAVASTQS